MTFAERLRQLREKAGMTQTGLAEASGLPLGSIRNYEQGQRDPYWPVVFKLAAGLDVSCEEFADCTPSVPQTRASAKKRRRGKK
jgi:transcriptional regulator with XRE-family HTH domain